jgi:hypothetical protein
MTLLHCGWELDAALALLKTWCFCSANFLQNNKMKTITDNIKPIINFVYCLYAVTLCTQYMRQPLDVDNSSYKFI